MNIGIRDRGFKCVAIKINVARDTCVKELKVRVLNIHVLVVNVFFVPCLLYFSKILTYKKQGKMQSGILVVTLTLSSVR